MVSVQIQQEETGWGKVWGGGEGIVSLGEKEMESNDSQGCVMTSVVSHVHLSGIRAEGTECEDGL